jgi:hypothetical protein
MLTATVQIALLMLAVLASLTGPEIVVGTVVFSALSLLLVKEKLLEWIGELTSQHTQ